MKLNKVHTLHANYVSLISEYPYLKHLIIHSAILVSSLVILFIGNIPLFHRLGSILDWLQFFAILGLFYGVIAGSAPYLKLDLTAKPYNKVIEAKLREEKKASSWGRDLVIGISAIVSSFMILAIFFAVFETTSESQDNLIFLTSLGLFLLGVYFFIKSLRLVSVSKWLFRNVSQLFSLTAWKNLFEAIFNSSVTVSYDRRNRIERLQDDIMATANSTTTPTESIYESLRKLSQEDYLIVSVKAKPELFVQFHKMTGHIRLELPVTNKNKHKIKTAITVLESKNVFKGLWIGQIQLNPHSYYYLGKWTDAEETVTGDLLAVICKDNVLEAADLGLALLSEVHKWNGNTNLEYTVNTFNDGWWHNL